MINRSEGPAEAEEYKLLMKPFRRHYCMIFFSAILLGPFSRSSDRGTVVRARKTGRAER